MAGARATNLTTTWAGLVGSPRERKSRTGPLWRQKGQSSLSPGAMAPMGATGASHRAHASVPTASVCVRVARPSSS
jgi:hypothetical protein